MKEIELGKAAVAYFSEQVPFEVYQEVPLLGGFVDVVVKIDKYYHCVECKTSLSLAVIAQALERKPWCHYSSIFVPFAKKSDGKRLALRILQQYGIGCYEYNPKWFQTVIETISPKINRKVITKYLDSGLLEEHKTYALAGSKNTKRLTPFRHTVDELVRYVKRNEGVLFREALDAIKTHYKTQLTARSCLLEYIRKGVISELRVEYGDQGQLLLFSNDADEASLSL